MSDKAQIEALRESAARARRLAWWLVRLDDRQRLLSFAAELEEKADALLASLLPEIVGDPTGTG